MSEKEKSIALKVAKAIPRMSEFDKGYLLGKVETLAEGAKEGEEEDGEPDNSGYRTTD